MAYAAGAMKLNVDSEPLSPASNGTSSPLDSPLSADFHLASEEFLGLGDELISRDLAVLEQLRRNVHKNLRLRPIRSASPLVPIGQSIARPSPPPSSDTFYDLRHNQRASPLSPANHHLHLPQRDQPQLSPQIQPHPPQLQHLQQPPQVAQIQQTLADSQPDPEPHDPPIPLPYDPTLLLRRLTLNTRPLLIDTRPAGSYLASRIQYSINLAIPSLIIKRCRKPNGGFANLAALRAFISTERGKDAWDNLMNPAGPWNGDVVIYDEEMDESDILSPGRPKPPPPGQSSTAWILLSVLHTLIEGQLYYLRGGISAARHTTEADLRIVSGEREAMYGEEDDDDDEPAINLSHGSSTATGLFSLRTDVAARSRPMPEIEPQSASPQSSPPPPVTTDNTPVPSPAPPIISSSRPQRSAAAAALPRLDTSGAQTKTNGPPKLSLRTGAKALAAPGPSHNAAAKLPRLRLQSVSPTPNVTVINDPGTPTSSSAAQASPTSPSSFHTASPTTPHTRRRQDRDSSDPHTPLPASPVTARPPDSPTSPIPEFVVSTILPNFLFLGPELVVPEHVKQLKDLGVKRILNIAIECDDDLGLNLRKEFERYDRIPMRDTVEEVNVARGMQEVCEFLDDARLHSAPTYVHCKAGKSRSVTAVMAYLIHANHWTLSKAYAFVLERRKGISPNIGFVSELMNFEEGELGGKSIGVAGPGAGDNSKSGNYGVAAGGRRPGHNRESLPPVFQSSQSSDGIMTLGNQKSAGTPGSNPMTVLQGPGEEKEIRDGTGRYRHARRAPVDDVTLQPMRRVSKAGLESGSWT